MHEFLIEKLNSSYSDEDVKLIIEGLKCDRVTTFRVNTLKSNCAFVENELLDNNIKFRNCEFIDTAYILDTSLETKMKLQKLNIYENGSIYIFSLYHQ